MGSDFSLMQLGKQPGSYILVLQSHSPGNIIVGRLGKMAVEPGYYLYTGSAFGPGGLCGRLAHHLRPVIRSHWHIDYLRQVAEVLEIWISASPSNLEHAWAEMLMADPMSSIPLPGFGASDCRCPAHLVYYSVRPEKWLFRW